MVDSSTGREPLDIFIKHIGNHRLADELLRSNIFAYHHEDADVSIQSRPMFLHLSSEIGSPGSPQRAGVEKLFSSSHVKEEI
jgi:hypothetical protein